MVSRAVAQAQVQLQKQIFVRGEAAYQCDTCARKIRVPTNRYGLTIIQRCIITQNCLGKLHPILTAQEANNVSSVPPSVPGVVNWSQRKVFFAFEQPIASTIWTVDHNLNNKPTVQVFVTQGSGDNEMLVEVDPLAIRIINPNTIEIEFENAQKGIAQLVTLASANTTNPSVTTVTTTTQDTLLLTKAGEMTIATLDTTTLISFTITYRTPNVPEGFINVAYVGVDNVPSINSPWAGAHRVFIGGKTYTVRSFNILQQPTAPPVFADNLIANGTQFYFSSLPSTPNRNLILLGTSPFTVVDRNVNQYVDIGLISQVQPELAYAGGNAYAAGSVIRNVYPPIMVVD